MIDKFGNIANFVFHSSMRKLSGTTHQTISLHLQDAPTNAKAANLALTTILRSKGRILDSTIDSLQTIRERLTQEDVNVGEGVYGLRRALALAGSESQVISLWQVDDFATKDLMVKYYQRVLDNEGRSEAMRQTQLGMLVTEGYQHPYYWASFIPSGDWREMNAASSRQ